MDLRVVVVVPCFNEAVTIARVVEGFRRSLPEAQVLVVDNASTDNTAAVALAAGATVLSEASRGKGHALRRAFREVQADVVIMVDGDATYDPAAAPELVSRMVGGRLDLLNAARVPVGGALKRRRAVGNRLISATLRLTFGSPLRDPLSGYKVLSSTFVRGFPGESNGFDVETELVVHALRTGARIAERSAPYAERPEGSTSKLSSVRDGVVILRAIWRLWAE